MGVPLLVFLHGLGQTPQSWQDQVTALPAGTRAVAPWLEGCRPGASAPFEVGRAADAVLAQLNRHGVDQVALCGTGLGAVVATEAAIRSPAAVSHLVVHGGLVHTPRWQAALQRTALKAVPTARFAEAGIDRAKLSSLVAALTGADFRGRLGAITARTLVLLGSDDRAGEPGARALADGIPGARLEVIASGGPLPHVTQPAEVNRLLYDFLA